MDHVLGHRLAAEAIVTSHKPVPPPLSARKMSASKTPILRIPGYHLHEDRELHRGSLPAYDAGDPTFQAGSIQK